MTAERHNPRPATRPSGTARRPLGAALAMRFGRIGGLAPHSARSTG